MMRDGMRIEMKNTYIHTYIHACSFLHRTYVSNFSCNFSCHLSLSSATSAASVKDRPMGARSFFTMSIQPKVDVHRACSHLIHLGLASGLVLLVI